MINIFIGKLSNHGKNRGISDFPVDFPITSNLNNIQSTFSSFESFKANTLASLNSFIRNFKNTYWNVFSWIKNLFK